MIFRGILPDIDNPKMETVLLHETSSFVRMGFYLQPKTTTFVADHRSPAGATAEAMQERVRAQDQQAAEA